MATYKHLRSSTANKRPTTSIADGQLAINTNTASPGLFFKDSAGTGIVKVGPVHVGTTAPNSVPASGGSTGNYLGEQWLDTSVSPAQMKVWNGSTWVGVVADELPVSKLQDGAARQLIQTDAAGTGVEWTSNVDVPGTLDVTSTATFDSIAQYPLGSAGAPTITFTGDNNTGIYSPGADQVAISTAGSGRLFVDASGNVLVGTASSVVAGYKLQVNGSCGVASTANAAIEFGIRTPDATFNDAYLSFGTPTQNRAQIYCTGGAANTGSLVFNTYNAGAGSERLRITSAGLVGIGTSSPSTNLHIGSSAGGTDLGVLLSRGATTNFFEAYDGTKNFIAGTDSSNAFVKVGSLSNHPVLIVQNNGEAIYIDTSKRVGIGTTSPGNALHVVGNIQTGSTADTVFTNKLSVVSSAADLSINSASANITFLNGSTPTERARIDSSGRLLVGTSSAFDSANLATSYNAGIEGNGSFAGIALKTNKNSTEAAYISLGKSRGTTANSKTVVSSGDTLGYLGFEGADGTNMKEAASIAAFVDGTPGANDMPGRLVFSTTADGASSPTERMRIASNGKTTIKGSTSDSSAYSLEVTESGGIVQFTIRNDGVILTGTDTLSPYNNTTASAANLFVTSGGELQRSTSSIKYKRNVEDSVHGLTELLQLRPVTYQSKADSDGEARYGGLIAEEVDAVGLSEFVQYAEDGSPDALAYGNMVSLCIKAIQEQQAVIEELQAKIAALEGN
jgi:hypothetical protein